MGVKDSDILHEIYEKIKIFCKKNDLPYHFKVDNGDFETAIEFKEVVIDTIHHAHPPWAKNWDSNPEIKCPDILDYNNRIIFEYEEKGCKVRSGAYLPTKGHGREFDMTNQKDTQRDRLYKLGKFKVLKFYETDLKDKNWTKLYEFLLKCHNS